MTSRSFSAIARACAIGVVILPLAGCDPKGSLAGGGTREKALERVANQLPDAAVKVSGEPGTFGSSAKVAIPSDLTTFNPYFQVDASTGEVLGQLYATLVEYDPVARDIKANTGLAEKFEVKDNKVLVTVRPGLLFSDGTPIDSSDVLYSLKMAMDPQVASPVADMLSVSGRLPNVRRVDDRTVEMEFVDKYQQIGYVLSQVPVLSAGLDWQATLDRGHFEEALGIKTAPEKIACSGPYRVASYAAGKELVLEYNPHYWRVDAQGRRLPYIDQVKYQIGLQPDAVANQLKIHTTDVAEYLPAAKFVALEQSDKFTTKDLGVGLGTWQLVVNYRADANTDRVKATWLRNAKFREFLSRSIDRDRIVKEVFAGKATPVYGPVTPANTFWYNDSIAKFGYDPGQATAAREAALFKVEQRDGAPQMVDVQNRKVSFSLYYPKDDEGEAMKNIIVKALGDQGVAIKAVPFDAGTLLTKYLKTGAFELVLWRSDPASTDPISYMPVFMSNGRQHFYMQSDPGKSESGMEWETEINRLMREIQKKPLAEERKAEFMKVQKIWAENMPIIYIAADNVLVAAASDLGNLSPVAISPNVTWNIEHLFFKNS